MNRNIIIFLLVGLWMIHFRFLDVIVSHHNYWFVQAFTAAYHKTDSGNMIHLQGSEFSSDSLQDWIEGSCNISQLPTTTHVCSQLVIGRSCGSDNNIFVIVYGCSLVLELIIDLIWICTYKACNSRFSQRVKNILLLIGNNLSISVLIIGGTFNFISIISILISAYFTIGLIWIPFSDLSE